MFDNVLKPFYDRHITLKTLSHHPTKILFELFQAQGCQQFQVTKDKDDGFAVCQSMETVSFSLVEMQSDVFASHCSRRRPCERHGHDGTACVAIGLHVRP